MLAYPSPTKERGAWRPFPRRGGAGGEVIGPSIQFRDVSFSYPGSRGDALSQFNLEIPAGQIAAAVENLSLDFAVPPYPPNPGNIAPPEIGGSAGVVHVMEEGRVMESGTHAELVAAGGRDVRPWTAQTEGVICP